MKRTIAMVLRAVPLTAVVFVLTALLLGPVGAAGITSEQAVARAVEFAGAVGSNYAALAPELTAVLGGEKGYPNCWQVIRKKNIGAGGGTLVDRSTGWVIHADGPGFFYQPSKGQERISPAQAAASAENYLKLAFGGTIPANYRFWGVTPPRPNWRDSSLSEATWKKWLDVCSSPVPLEGDWSYVKDIPFQTWEARWERTYQNIPCDFGSVSVTVSAYTGQLALLSHTRTYNASDPNGMTIRLFRSELAVQEAQQFVLQKQLYQLGFPTEATLKVIRKGGTEWYLNNRYLGPDQTCPVWALRFQPYGPYDVGWVWVTAETNEVAGIMLPRGTSQGPLPEAPKVMPKVTIPEGWRVPEVAAVTRREYFWKEYQPPAQEGGRPKGPGHAKDLLFASLFFVLPLAVLVFGVLLLRARLARRTNNY